MIARGLLNKNDSKDSLVTSLPKVLSIAITIRYVLII